ncbi:hypothetical protein FRC04_006693 [Tulasnella sp. 424]|nr:hypothetical protein FRC04_006693 [Tulasnella sp. 424]KAG8966730.1 hypothetical protein FRC05_002443 [Tulasnella sp. 425]
MRLQYAKLKVDHGWTRQNLDEVENLYFHHYRDRRPAPPPQQPKAPQRRIGAAPFASPSSISVSTSHVHAGVAGPSGSQSSTLPTSAHQSTESSTLATQPTIIVDSALENDGPPPIGYDPSVYSVGPSSSSSLPPQPSTSTSVPRTTSSPHPAVRTSRQGSRSHPYAVQPSATSAGSSSLIPPSSPQKVSAKRAGKAPVRGGGGTGSAGSKSVGKASSKTSTPSTLQPPQIAESTTAARLAQMLGTKTSTAAVGSPSATVSPASSFPGPTSYESFWNQLESRGSGARTSSPSKSTLGSTPAAPPNSLSVASSGTWKSGLTPTSSFGSLTSTSAPLSQPQPPPPTSSTRIPAPVNVPSSSTLSHDPPSTTPYHSLFRALQVTPEQLAASDARLNAATSEAQIGSYNSPTAAFVMSGSKVLDRLPPATQSNLA